MNLLALAQNRSMEAAYCIQKITVNQAVLFKAFFSTSYAIFI